VNTLKAHTILSLIKSTMVLTDSSSSDGEIEYELSLICIPIGKINYLERKSQEKIEERTRLFSLISFHLKIKCLKFRFFTPQDTNEKPMKYEIISPALQNKHGETWKGPRAFYCFGF
jgi:hypothetical protein